jgi:hypothetical protein
MDKTPATGSPSFPAVDYDNLDAAALNEQVRRMSEAQAAPSAPSVPPAVEAAEAALTLAPPPPPPSPGFKGRLKGRMRRLLVPFYPFLRLLSLPAHEELVTVVQALDHTNRRVDDLTRRLVDLDRSLEYVKLLHMLGHNLTVELTKLRIEHDALKSQVRLLEKDLDLLTRRERAVERRVAP